MEEPGWELYRTFLGVLEAGSLSGAARALGLTQPTVGRHVDALEAALGLSLFVRTQQGLSPTAAAHALHPHARAVANASAALLRAASRQGGDVRGKVRVTASDIVTVEVLPPVFAALHRAHPELVFELSPSNRGEDLLEREADIAVRMFEPAQQALIARRIGAIEIGVYAHRDYLAQRGVPRRLDELSGHALIGYDRETAFIRAVKSQLPWLNRQRFAWRSDSDLAGLAALRAGFGISFCQVGIAQREPALVRLFAKEVALTLPTWIAMHEDLRDSPACRVTFDALAEGLAGYISGQAGSPRAGTRAAAT